MEEQEVVNSVLQVGIALLSQQVILMLVDCGGHKSVRWLVECYDYYGTPAPNSLLWLSGSLWTRCVAASYELLCCGVDGVRILWGRRWW